MMKRRVFAGIAIAILFIVGRAAWVAIPDTGGIIHACFSTSNNPNTRGTLRIIDMDAGETCHSDEGLIAWDATDRTLYSKNASFSFPAAGSSSQTLQCDAGDIATGGGFRLHTSTPSIRVEESHQTLSLSGWVLTIQNDVGSATTAEIFVICKNLTL